MSNWWESIKNTFEVTSLSDRRQKQLEQEKVVDEKLQQSRQECSQCVQDYMFRMRRLHRTMSQKIYEAPFYEYPTKYKEYMDKIDHYQEPLANGYPPNNPDTCKTLSWLNELLKEEPS